MGVSHFKNGKQKLTPKQKLFCREYLVDLNTTRVIYQAINLITGKSYVGFTMGGLGRRIKNHFSGAKRRDDLKFKTNNIGKKFYNSIREYGEDVWDLKILDRCLNREEGNLKEKYYIKKIGTFEDGYNETFGGLGVEGRDPWNKGLKGVQTAWNKGIPKSCESKKKQSRAMTGKKGLRGNKSPMFGRPAVNRVAVRAINVSNGCLIGIYESILECGMKSPISHSSVKKILSGRFKSLKGVTVEYCD